ncbi:MAG: hypothetical protein ACKV19_16715 [Verrucomicrobiales bacterium]
MKKRNKPLSLAMALAAFAVAGQTHASTIAYRTTYFDVDYASAGYGGMRGGDGTGSITLGGVSGTVQTALLYWHGPQNSVGENASVTFDGNAIRGVSLGVSDDNCWGFENSEGYRADVTAFVTGNGAYSLANFINGAADINGVSLLVMFDDGDDTNNRDIVLFDGNDSNINNPNDADGWNVSLDNINYTAGSASMELGVGDGQTFLDDSIIVNGNTIAPVGGNFDGNSVPNGPFGPSNGGLWDIKSFDVTALLNPGLNDLELTSGVNSDCLALVHAVINLPAGAAPPPPPVPDTGGTLALFAFSTVLMHRLFGKKKAA